MPVVNPKPGASPLALLSQAVTAMVFILMQSITLGLVAGAVVAVQVVLIPRLRRRLLVLMPHPHALLRVVSPLVTMIGQHMQHDVFGHAHGEIVVDDAAGVFIYNTRWYGPYSKRVSGIRFSPVNSGQDFRWASMKH